MALIDQCLFVRKVVRSNNLSLNDFRNRCQCVLFCGARLRGFSLGSALRKHNIFCLSYDPNLKGGEREGGGGWMRGAYV